MNTNELKLKKLFTTVGIPRLRSLALLRVTLAVFALFLLPALPAQAQTPTPSPSPVNPCPPSLMPGQPFIPVPIIRSGGGKLRGTIILSSENQWMTFRVPQVAPSASSRSQCMPQFVRMFREFGAASNTDAAPYGPYAKIDPSTKAAFRYPLPRPGPTLRARVGDLVQLTFINQINPADFPYSIDRGETGEGGGCDQSSAGYPGSGTGRDQFPDCFHGSSTGNIHFHGTHTNPNTTADNVFIEVRPSLREDGKPVVTSQSVAKSFDKFFAKCEVELDRNFLREWPKTWGDLPDDWTDEQKKLLKAYDSQLEKNHGPGVRKLWPIDEGQIKAGAWPQYYIGAFPYCFRLPEYTPTVWPPPAPAAIHTGGAGTAEMHADGDSAGRPLIMGQSPGTHWYHAHKHGSTAINVANGMTGAFIIEGQYDDDLNTWYGANWTQGAQVLVINQLGVTPNLLRGGQPGSGQIDKGPDFSINGQMKPVIAMQPGQVQMWRIINTSGRASVFFTGPPADFQWKQLAQDGVQFDDTNYKKASNRSFLLAPGNRADLLVKAPGATCAIAGGCKYNVMVQNEVDQSDLVTANKITLLTVNVSGTPVDPTTNQGNFIPTAPTQPAFLTDIKDSEVTGTKTITFASGPAGGLPSPAAHTIDGEKFDGEVGAVVLLNNVEEWKIVNKTWANTGAAIAHPFHIHINPFQITEVFSPFEVLFDKSGKAMVQYSNATGKVVIGPNKKPLPATKYVFLRDYYNPKRYPGQCYLDPQNPETWKPCGSTAPTGPRIWWDTFPIPTGVGVLDAKFNPVVSTKNGQPVQVPGYFKMRSRFVDYSGFYVIHCHILAHEDRGMMTIVEVAPVRTPYSHH